MGKLGGEMKALAKKAGGSFKTVDDRIHIVQRFSRHLRSLNIQIQRVEQVKVRHIECYIQARLAQEIGKRTLQNEMTALRGVLQQAGRKQVAEHERLTNKSLGLAGASRNGTNRAITPEYYQQVLEAARDKDAGLAVTLELARLMGLRSQEAVQCCQSLKTWKQALERGETRLTVVFGTKGHRPRETVIQDTGAVKKALDNALADGDLYPTLITLCVGAGCTPLLSGAGIQRQRSAGADLNGSGPRRRARAVCGAGLRATGRRGIISCSGAIMKSKRPKGKGTLRVTAPDRKRQKG